MSNCVSHPDHFVRRHIGPRPEEIPAMVNQCGFETLDAMIDAAVPANIRSHEPLEIPPALSEHEALVRLRGIAAKNQVFRSYIGMGYYDTITPPVIQRNILAGTPNTRLTRPKSPKAGWRGS
jgi:glycine dehydrogenase